mmetsp:Transcript_28513/g.66233  ORF Transcript_28513/g.66233 Transcript_28513/m.66233 type:complete len:384 (-) Transcript_28513:1744-2895(-)
MTNHRKYPRIAPLRRKLLREPLQKFRRELLRRFLHRHVLVIVPHPDSRGLHPCGILHRRRPVPTHQMVLILVQVRGTRLIIRHRNDLARHPSGRLILIDLHQNDIIVIVNRVVPMIARLRDVNLSGLAHLPIVHPSLIVLLQNVTTTNGLVHLQDVLTKVLLRGDHTPLQNGHLHRGVLTMILDQNGHTLLLSEIIRLAMVVLLQDVSQNGHTPTAIVVLLNGIDPGVIRVAHHLVPALLVIPLTDVQYRNVLDLLPSARLVVFHHLGHLEEQGNMEPQSLVGTTTRGTASIDSVQMSIPDLPHGLDRRGTRRMIQLVCEHKRSSQNRRFFHCKYSSVNYFTRLSLCRHTHRPKFFFAQFDFDQNQFRFLSRAHSRDVQNQSR